jgi:hypothetical protein
MALALGAAVTLATLAMLAITPGAVAGPDDDPALGGDAWYTPVEEDFRPIYDGDAANKKVQTWAQYWGWVTHFYDGNFFSKGWTDQVRANLDKVRVASEKTRLRSQLNALGRDLCREWAKDNGVRKVATADLRRYAAEFDAAGRVEDGSGRKLREAIKSVRDDYRRKMKNR